MVFFFGDVLKSSEVVGFLLFTLHSSIATYAKAREAVVIESERKRSVLEKRR